MTSALQGSKTVRSEIKRFHGCLNQSNLVPDQCYRMSNIHYPMVSFTNQIIALFLSKNYDAIPIFIQRVLKSMNRTAVQPNTERYRRFVLDYLCQVTYFLMEFTSVDKEFIHRHVPEHIREAGPKKAPAYDPEKLEFIIS